MIIIIISILQIRIMIAIINNRKWGTLGMRVLRILRFFFGKYA